MTQLSFFDGPQRAAVRLLAWLLLAAPLATAQPALVKDIVPTGTDPLTGPRSFKPASLVSLNGTVYFSAYDPRYGRELWKSNGTPAGTVLLKDIIAGAYGSAPADLAVVNNTLYFTAADGPSGRELWKSDGTSAGTVRVKDIAPGAGSSAPANLVGVGSTLYFTANDGAGGVELWKSNGTSAGTVRVKDIVPGAPGASPRALTAVNNTLYFVAEDARGHELWKSDGTPAGTVMVKDIVPGPAGAFGYGSSGVYSPPSLAAMNGILYFGADDGVHGFELWKSDGTAAGTVLVADIYPGYYYETSPNSSAPQELLGVNGTLYFSASDEYAGRELWKSDGTEAGTTLLTDIEPGFETYVETFNSSSPAELTNVNGTVFFAASSGYEGRELWKATPAGAVMVKDLRPGTEYVPHPYRPGFGWQEPLHSDPTNLTNVNGVLYCLSYTGLWKSDGTEAGTVLLKPLEEGSNLVANGNTLFLSARLGTDGVELWKSNGTSASTVLVKGAPTGIPAGANPQYTLNVNGTLYFAAGNPTAGYALWKSSGTSAGTTLVKRIGPELRDFVNAGGKLFFIGNDGTHGAELWKSDGTAAGTVMVKDLSASGDASIKYLTAVNGVVYFAAATPGIGEELWKSDGTAAGTVLVEDIYPGGYEETDYETWEDVFYPYHSNPSMLTAVNGVLYFRADSPAGEGELWRSNGTAAGTYLVRDINPGLNYNNKPKGAEIRHLTGLNGTLYFSANDGNGHRLWKSNGTEGGTVKLKDVPVQQIRKAGNVVYFWGGDGYNPIQLWKSDGTPAGTVLVKTIDVGVFGPSPEFLATVGNVVYFTTEHITYGRELWKSDGTAAGTVMVKDLSPGATGSSFGSRAVLGTELYFAAAREGRSRHVVENGRHGGRHREGKFPACHPTGTHERCALLYGQRRPHRERTLEVQPGHLRGGIGGYGRARRQRVPGQFRHPHGKSRPGRGAVPGLLRRVGAGAVAGGQRGRPYVHGARRQPDGRYVYLHNKGRGLPGSNPFRNGNRYGHSAADGSQRQRGYDQQRADGHADGGRCPGWGHVPLVRGGFGRHPAGDDGHLHYAGPGGHHHLLRGLLRASLRRVAAPGGYRDGEWRYGSQELPGECRRQHLLYD
jgi:ELWxxDGT repeat protein